MAERIGGLIVNIVLLVLMAGNIGISQANQLPKGLVTDIGGVTRVSTEDIFDLYEKLPSLVIVDSRLATGPSSGRANGFIEGSINLQVFPETPASRFWSGTFDTRHPKNFALFVDFKDGYGDDRHAAFAYSVRLVRGGQQLAEFDRKN